MSSNSAQQSSGASNANAKANVNMSNNANSPHLPSSTNPTDLQFSSQDFMRFVQERLSVPLDVRTENNLRQLLEDHLDYIEIKWTGRPLPSNTNDSPPTSAVVDSPPASHAADSPATVAYAPVSPVEVDYDGGEVTLGAVLNPGAVSAYNGRDGNEAVGADAAATQALKANQVHAEDPPRSPPQHVSYDHIGDRGTHRAVHPPPTGYSATPHVRVDREGNTFYNEDGPPEQIVRVDRNGNVFRNEAVLPATTPGPATAPARGPKHAQRPYNTYRPMIRRPSGAGPIRTAPAASPEPNVPEHLRTSYGAKSSIHPVHFNRSRVTKPAPKTVYPKSRMVNHQYDNVGPPRDLYSSFFFPSTHPVYPQMYAQDVESGPESRVHTLNDGELSGGSNDELSDGSNDEFSLSGGSDADADEHDTPPSSSSANRVGNTRSKSTHKSRVRSTDRLRERRDADYREQRPADYPTTDRFKQRRRRKQQFRMESDTEDEEDAAARHSINNNGPPRTGGFVGPIDNAEVVGNVIVNRAGVVNNLSVTNGGGVVVGTPSYAPINHGSRAPPANNPDVGDMYATALLESAPQSPRIPEPPRHPAFKPADTAQEAIAHARKVLGIDDTEVKLEEVPRLARIPAFPTADDTVIVINSDSETSSGSPRAPAPAQRGMKRERDDADDDADEDGSHEARPKAILRPAKLRKL